uniref:Uncharacterized protein LOC114345149 n=1 Tax=Diabrotica virgifera virgifera TaxID=50390 RepID=A0A6P7H255_DIAVI
MANKILAMAVKAEIKDPFVEDDPRYIQSQLSTSLDLGDLKNEADYNNSVMKIKGRIKEEFVESSARYIKDQLSTSCDLRDLKNEARSEDPSGKTSDTSSFSLPYPYAGSTLLIAFLHTILSWVISMLISLTPTCPALSSPPVFFGLSLLLLEGICTSAILRIE